MVTRLPWDAVNVPGSMALAATGKPENAVLAAEITARQLRGVGVNFNLAPDLDVNSNPMNPVIGVRSFGDDPQSVALFGAQLCPGKTMADIKAAYAAKYTGPVVHYQDPACADGFLSAAAMSGKDSMVVSVSGNDERIVLTAVFDNLGKGASGAALECLNLVMGKEKGFGLDL